MSYFKKAFKGITWMGLLRISTRLLVLIKLAVLARLLDPADFGIFGIGSLVLALLEMLTETGITIILIQMKENYQKYLDSAWVISIIRGIIISLFLLILSYPISHFFNSPKSLQILLFLSILPFIKGFINPSIIKYQKYLNFKKEFYLRLLLFIIDTLTVIVIAYPTRSAISLVFGMICASIVELFISFKFIKPTPKFIYDINILKNILKRGKWITLAGIFDYIFHYGDDIIVGKILGTYSLGLYQVSYKFSTLPISESGEIINKVVFPIFSTISNDKLRLKKAFIKVLLSTTLISTLFAIFLFIFAVPLTEIILGQKWLYIIPSLKILLIFGVLRSISNSITTLFFAVRKQEYITLINLFSILFLSITIYPFVVKYGIIGAALSALLGTIMSIPLLYILVRKVFN